MPSLVWFITGASAGFGEEITKAALARGDRVIATARNIQKAAPLKELGAATVALDVTWPEDKIENAVAESLKVYGQIDILINNAGYLLEGGVEEVSAEEGLKTFQTNVLGAMTVTRAILPHMRARKSGVVANMGSTAAWTGGASLGYYCATKMALAALSISLKQELAHLGIDVILIDPGYFRTNMLGSGSRVTAAKTIEDYSGGALTIVKNALNQYNLNQPGSPAKAAAVIVEVCSKSGRMEGKKLPARLPLGADAYEFIDDVLSGFKKELDEWKYMGVGLNVEE